MLQLSNAKSVFFALLLSAIFAAAPAEAQEVWTTDGLMVGTNTNNEQNSVTISDSTGGAFVVYVDSARGAVANHVDYAGRKLWGADGIAISDLGVANYNPCVISDGSSGIIISFHAPVDAGPDFNNVYLQRISASGELLWGDSAAIAHTTAAGDQLNATIVSDGSGGAIVAYESEGVDYDIMINRMDSNGSVMWGTDGVVVCNTVNDQANPRIISDGASWLIVAWEDFRNGNWDIYADKVSTSGVPMGNVAICNAGGNQLNHVMAQDGAGGVFFFWEDQRSGNYDIYGQFLSQFGIISWATNGIVICNDTNTQRNPSAALHSTGDCVVAWDDTRTSGGDIYGQIVATDGTIKWGSNGKILVTDSNKQEKPLVLPRTDGLTYLVWQDKTDLANYRNILLQIMDEDGDAQWAAPVTLAGTTLQETDQFAYLDYEGSILVSWETGYSLWSGWDVGVQKVDALGLVKWPSLTGIPLSLATNIQTHSASATDTSGNVFIAWADRRSGTNYDIYATKLDSDGAFVWPRTGVAVCTQASDQFFPQVCPDGSGGAIIVWRDGRGTIDIYGEKVSSAGVVQWGAGTGKAICNSTGAQYDPQILSDGLGGAYVAWFDARWGNLDIYAVKIDGSTGDASTGWTANGTAVCVASGDQAASRMVTDGTDGVILIWQDYRSGNWDVYAQRMTSTGTAQWAANGIVVCDAAGEQIYPEAAADGSGGAFMVWNDFRDGYWTVLAQRVDTNGTVGWDSDPGVTVDGVAVCSMNIGADYDIDRPYAKVVKAADAAEPVVVWRDKRGADFDMYAQRLTSAGATKWTLDGIVIVAETGDQQWSADLAGSYFDSVGPDYFDAAYGDYSFGEPIAADGAGGVFIAWCDDRLSTANSDIYAVHVGADGSFSWSPRNLTQLASSDGPDQETVTLCGDGDSYAFGVWRDMRNEANGDLFITAFSREIPPPSALLSVTAGPASPASRNDLMVDEQSLAMLQLRVANTGSEPVAVQTISFTASGSADDSADIMLVSLYYDADANGAVNGSDILLGTGTYGSDDGRVTIGGIGRSILALDYDDYLLVYQLGGTVSIGEAFVASLAAGVDIVASGEVSYTAAVVELDAEPITGGVMTVFASGFSISLGAKNPVANASVMVDDLAYEMMQLKLVNSGTQQITVNEIYFTGSGTANELDDIFAAHIYEDADNNGYFSTSDTVVKTLQTYVVDDGKIAFTGLGYDLAPSTTAYWLLVYDFNGTAAIGESFKASVASVSDVVSTAVPSGNFPLTGNQMQVGLPPSDTFIIQTGSANPSATSELNDAVKVPMLQLKITNNSSKNASVTSIKFASSGSSNEFTDITAVGLYYDSNANGKRDSGEAQIGSLAVFSEDNGYIVFNGAPLRTIAAGEYENWILTYTLGGTAVAGKTFKASLASTMEISYAGVTGVAGSGVIGGTKTIVSGSAISATVGTAPFTVDFSGNFGAAVSSYSADFDYDTQYGMREDWFSFESLDMSHTYDTPGDYTARVSVQYENGSTTTQDFIITVDPAADAPTAIASASTATIGYAPFLVNFNGTASPAESTSIAFYAWDFNGDGVYDWTSTTSGIATNMYTSSGSYMAYFYAVSNTGSVGFDDILITVQAPNTGTVPAVYSAVATPSSPEIGEETEFTATAGAGTSGSLVLYEWDFEGDGIYDWSSTSSASASWVYKYVGSYIARVRVTDSENLSATKTVTVSVTMPDLPYTRLTQPTRTWKVTGNAVTLLAQCLPAFNADSLRFQYRQVGDTSWTNIGGPMSTPPFYFGASWDTASLSGNYEIRTAVVCGDFPPSTVTSDSFETFIVNITATSPDLAESLDSTDGTYEQTTSQYKTKACSASLIDGTSVRLPLRAISADDKMTLSTLTENPTADVSLDFVEGTFREASLQSANLVKPAVVSIPYPDSNDDGIVDGTDAVSEKELKMFLYDGSAGIWVLLADQTVDMHSNAVSAKTSSLGLFVLAPADTNTGDGGDGGEEVDIAAPIFSGAVKATVVSATTVTIEWSPAVDSVTAQSNIVYLIYSSTTAGGQAYATPSYTTSAGVVSYEAVDLVANTPYYFVVRARDEAGNADSNTVQVTATTASVPSFASDDGGVKETSGGCFITVSGGTGSVPFAAALALASVFLAMMIRRK